MSAQPRATAGTRAAAARPGPPRGGGGRSAIGSRVRAWLRARVWAVVFALLTDGVTISGEVPVRPVVLVANHSSHADTALVSRALGVRREVIAVAAAEYWLRRVWRRWAARTLIGIVPVSRSGGASAQLLAAKEVLDRGHSVLVFPEGTRTRDGRLGSFHAGAFRLAAAAGVPVVPVGIAGTRRVLGPGTGYRRGPLAIHFGPALDPPSPGASRADLAAYTGAVRTTVAALAARGAAERPGRTWLRVHANATGWIGLTIVACWAFAEGLSWPLIAELPLVGLAATAGARRGAVLLAASAAASVAGVLVHYTLVRHGVHVPTPLTTDLMRSTARSQLADDVGAAFRYQVASGIPVKVYAQQAARAGIGLPDLLAGMWPRPLRIVVVGFAAVWVGNVARRPLQQLLGALYVAGCVIFPIALALVYRSWR